MPNHTIEQVLPNHVTNVAAACKEAVENLGWKVINQSDSRLVCKEEFKMISFAYPAHVDMIWRQEDDRTRLILRGSIFGFGQIQSGHLKGQMENLLNQIQIGLRNRGTVPGRDIMRDRGIIREREIIREIVKIPCTYCGSLVEITAIKCPTCGAPFKR